MHKDSNRPEDATLETETLSLESDPTESTPTESAKSSSHSPSAEEPAKRRHHRHHRRHHKSKRAARPAEEVTIEIRENEEPPLPTAAFDKSKFPDKANNQKNDKRCGSYPVSLEASESPLPPNVYDQSISKSSYSKQNHPYDIGYHLEEVLPFNAAPVPVGFVHDDSMSNKSSIKSKLYNATPPSSKVKVPMDCLGQPQHPSSDDYHKEPTAPSASAGNISRSSSDSNGELSTPLSANNHDPQSHSRAQCTNEAHSRSAQQGSHTQSFGSSSSDSSHDVEEGLNEYEIVADAVAVEEPDIYDAEPISNEGKVPNITINQVYPHSEDDTRRKSQGVWDSKFCWPAMILIAIIIGACMIIVGIVLGIKKSSGSSTNTTDNSHTENNSILAKVLVDDHGQVSNIFYNQTSNHYTIEYVNGTSQETTNPIYISDDNSIISFLLFNETSNTYVVQYKNQSMQDVVSPLFLDHCSTWIYY